MRIAMIVLLTLSVLGGVFAGGGLSWSLTAGPKSGDIKKADELMGELKKVAKGESPMLVAMEQDLRALRAIQYGGAALVVVNIALLVVVLKRKSRAIVIASAAAAVLAVAFFVLGAPKDLDDAAYTLGHVLGGLAAASAVLALAADRFGRPAPAMAPAPATMR
jgi:hypothetical protein